MDALALARKRCYCRDLTGDLMAECPDGHPGCPAREHIVIANAAAWTRTSTSTAPGSGRSTWASSSTSGSPKARNVTACIVAIVIGGRKCAPSL